MDTPVPKVIKGNEDSPAKMGLLVRKAIRALLGARVRRENRALEVQPGETVKTAKTEKMVRTV